MPPPPTGAGISSCGCQTCRYRELKYRKSLDMLMQHADHVALASFNLQNEIQKIRDDHPLTAGERAKVLKALRDLEAREQAFKLHPATPEAQLVQVAKLVRIAKQQLQSNSSDWATFQATPSDATRMDDQDHMQPRPHAQSVIAQCFQQPLTAGAVAQAEPSSHATGWGPERRPGRASPPRHNAPYSSGPLM